MRTHNTSFFPAYSLLFLILVTVTVGLVPGGVYFVQMDAGEVNQTMRMTLLKKVVPMKSCPTSS
jgi:hypothetical protein